MLISVKITTEQVAYLDFEALDYMYAAELYETIWEDIPGESPSDSPDAPSDVGIRVVPNPGTGTITATEERRFNTNCPICHEDFTIGQETVQYRCGHATCTDCFGNLIHSGWNSCTLCRRSGAARAQHVVVTQTNDNNSDDIGVFIRPENATAAASSSSNNIERSIEQCRANMQEDR